MTDTATFDQTLSELIPQNPHLVVFDPSQQWSDIQQYFQGYDLPLGVEQKIKAKSGKEILAFRTQVNSIPDCSLLISIAPKGGFDRGQTDTIKIQVASFPEKNHYHLCLALVDEDELTPPEGERCDAAYKTLIEELEREFGTRPLVYPRSSFKDISPETLSSFENLAHQGNAVLGWTSILNIIQDIGVKTSNASLKGAVSFDKAIEVLSCGRKAEGILTGIQTAKKNIRDSSIKQVECFCRWTDLTERGRDKCVQVARHAKNIGEVGDEIIPEDSDVVKEMRDRLNSVDWADPPFENLRLWRDEAIESLKTSDVVFPIVGVFSSGKTTLLNKIIGRSPKGRHLLRTSNTHNTALLCRFHHTQPQDSSRVVFSWQDRVENVSLLDYAPSDEGKPRAEARLLDIKRVEPLNLLTLKPRAIRSFLRFIQERILDAVRFEVIWREPYRDRANWSAFAKIRTGDIKLTQQTIELKSKESNYLIGALEKMVGTSQAEKELIKVPIWPRLRVPVKVTLTALITDSASRIKQHNLETDEDWDWFQGTIAGEENKNTRQPGFAESIEAEYLISMADIYLENPLFELISLVDTPGLNSVTEHHDHITEDFIRRGNLFLMMAKLGEASGHKDSPRLLDLMMQALKDNGISRDREVRIFLVLNWFRTQVGSRNKADATKRVKEFADLAKRRLNSENVRLYVVELSPIASSQPMPEEILGYPSLKPLIQDLKSFIANCGLSDRFAILKRRLTDAWDGHMKAIQRKMDNIDGEDIVKESRQKIEQALKSFKNDSGITEELYILARKAANDILHIYDKLSNRLSQIDKKEDFSDFNDRAESLMNEYNANRGDLGDALANQLTARLRSKLRGFVDTLPFVRAPMDQLTNIPTMPLQSFKSTMKKVVDNWPGLFGRIWHRRSHLFDSYAEIQRRELLSRFFPSVGKQRIKSALDELVNRYNSEIEKACNASKKSLEKRLAEIDMSAAELKNQRHLLEKENDSCDTFKHEVQWMQRTLSQNAGHL